MNRVFVTAVLLCSFNVAFSQSLLIDESLFDPKKKKTGPGRRHFTQGYFGLGTGDGRSPNNYSDFVGAFNLTLGLRHKVKTGSRTNILFDLGYQYQEWRFEAIEKTPMPTPEFSSLLWRKNKLNLVEVATNFRINFFRGNNTGPALDFGGGMLLNFASSQKFKGRDSLNNRINFDQKSWKPDNNIAFYYGARLSLWAVAVVWRQRFTPWLTTEDLPATTISIEIRL